MYNRKYFIPTGKYRADISLPPRIPKTVTGAYFLVNQFPSRGCQVRGIGRLSLV